ncbi:MAG TPA: hypothetical protein VF095_06140 [Bacillota bacterium]
MKIIQQIIKPFSNLANDELYEILKARVDVFNNALMKKLTIMISKQLTISLRKVPT